MVIRRMTDQTPLAGHRNETMAPSVEKALRQVKKLGRGIAERFSASKPAATASAPSPEEPPQERLNTLISLFGRRQLADVIEQATALISEFPGAAVPYNILGAAYAGLNNPDEAIASFRKALQIRPDYAEAHNSLGIALKDRGRLNEAIASFGQALQIKPDFAEAHNNLGAALKDGGRLDDAIASFSKALHFKPDFAQAHNNLGMALKDRGRPDEAVASFREAVQASPGFAQAHNNLGIALQDQGRLEEAIASYGEALRSRPDYAEAHNNLGVALKDQGRLDEAVASFGKALQVRPGFAQAHNNLGIALQGQGRLDAAIESFSKALQIRSGYAEAHNNLGIALQAAGRLDEAVASFAKAVQNKPDFSQAHNNLGAALKDQGRLEEAIASFNKALRINPGYAQAYNNLGAALQEQRRLEEAIASFGKALRIKPDYAEAHNNLGVALKDQDRLEEAIASFNKALKIRPDHAEAHSNLCELYEKQNNLTELEKAVGKAILNFGENNPEVLFRRAQLANGKGKFEDAAGYLDRIQAGELRPSLRPNYFSLLGKISDKLDRFDRAFAAFAKQNELTKDSADGRKFNADRYLNSILSRQEAWGTDARPEWTGAAIGARQASPTFLIGFPRSGTTLLDTILRSHAGIAVVEEKPMVAAMSKAFGQTQTIENLNRLPAADVARLREVYFKELKMHLDQGHDGKLIVDKLPLNISNAGFIQRVFPDAKFILVLRHPCDCVLSCFMQTFKLNDAMANFLSLDQSAKLYAAVMELWSLYSRKLDLKVHVLKYEDLIEDFEGTCKPLIAFLGLKWDENLRNYQKTALGRSSIRTPSYNQITQPLYKRASGRWINYRKQMESVLPLLQPWIEAYGYEEQKIHGGGEKKRKARVSKSRK